MPPKKTDEEYLAQPLEEKARVDQNVARLQASLEAKKQTEREKIQKYALAEIGKLIEVATTAKNKAVDLANKAGVTFYWPGPTYGTGASYNGDPGDGDGDDGDGWNSSSSSC